VSQDRRALHAQQRSDHEHVGRISTPTILFVITAAAIALYELQFILLPFVLAGLVSYICTPVIELARAKTHLPRSVVSVIAFLLLLAIGGLIALVGLPAFIREMTQLVTDFNGTIDRLVEGALDGRTVNLLGRSMNAQELAKAIGDAIRDQIVNARVLAVIAGAGTATVFGFFLTVLLLFFFLLSGPAIIRGLLWLIPPGQRPLIEDHILSNLDPVLKRYFIGVTGVVCFAAIFAYVGLGLILQLPHAIFLALVTGILEAIPMVGPIIAAAIAGLVAILHNSGIGAIIGYAVYLAALRLSIDQFFGPLVLGTAGRVHPALIIFCFLAGGSLFGIVGVIISVPIALVIKATLAVLYDEPPGGRE
jgi:predicted PurR-regulated permease PerM